MWVRAKAFALRLRRELQRRLLRSLDAVNPLETEDTFGNDQQRMAGLVLRLRCR